jgi:hypothetical protein
VAWTGASSSALALELLRGPRIHSSVNKQPIAGLEQASSLHRSRKFALATKQSNKSRPLANKYFRCAEQQKMISPAVSPRVASSHCKLDEHESMGVFATGEQ